MFFLILLLGFCLKLWYNDLMNKNKITRIAIVLFWSVASACGFVSAQTYQVTGSNALKIIQSGENTRSANFRVNAHIKPIGNVDSVGDSDDGTVDDGSTSVTVPLIPIVPPTTTTIPPLSSTEIGQTSGGASRRTSNWILTKKYDELVAGREDDLKASAPKKTLSFLPTDPDKVEKVSDLFVGSDKPGNDKLEEVPVEIINTEKKEQYASTPIYASNENYNSKGKLQDKEAFNSYKKDLNVKKVNDDMHAVAKKQEFTLYEKEEDCTEKQDDLGLDSSLLIFIFSVLALFFIIVICLIILLAWVFYLRHKEIADICGVKKSNVPHKEEPKKINKVSKLENKVKPRPTRKFRSLLSILLFLMPFLSFSQATFAETTTPQKIIYEGELSDASGNPLSGNYDFRFSLWANQDFESGDKDATGVLNAAAPDFFGWQEVQTYEITNNGRFTIQVGTTTPFTANLFDRSDMSLQVEIKAMGQVDSSYELIDLDYANDTVDRMVIDTVPYAFNADKLDFREAGYGIGEIPYLDDLGKLPSFLLPDIDALTLGAKFLGFEADNIPYLNENGKLTNDILPDDMHAASADTANHATTADNATHADTADHATTADTATNAENSNTVSGRTIGLTAEEIPYLDATGKLPTSILPDAIVNNSDALTLQGKSLGFLADNIPYLDLDGRLPGTALPTTIHATTADNATHADTADHATTADTATTANHATTADNATHADTADHATTADTATTANHATTADNATHADTSDSATNADNSNALGGKLLGFTGDAIPYLDFAGKLPSIVLPDNLHAATADEATHADDSDTLEGRSLGLAPNDIPYLDATGKLSTFIIPTNITVDNSNHADTADDATHADDADTVSGRTIGYTADEIPYLDFAGKIPNIILPDNIHAATADNATHADTADHATTADSATNADHADEADNAAALDGRSTGYSVGDIPFIDASGFLPASILPGGGLGSTGTDSNIFRLDEDGSAGPTDRISLQFGLTVAETLAWDIADDQFELSDDILINGNIQTTGTINGVTVGITDKNDILSPRYPNSIFQGDGTDNSKGYMYEEEGTVLGNTKNVLRWRSRNADIQDYDVVIRYALEDKFSSFQSPALSLEYLTEGLLIDSRIDVTVEKEGLLGDQLTGAGTGLSSNAWNKRTFELTGGATWNKGDVMIIRIKVHSRTDHSAKIADIVVHTREE